MQPLPQRAITALIVALLAVSACSSNDDIADLPPKNPSTTATPSTSSTSPTPTPSTTTTLSETEAAEAEIEQLLTDWWTGAYDGQGQDGGLEYLTGLIALRVTERVADYTAAGDETVNSQDSVIEIVTVAVDLEAGTGEATSCGGSSVLRRNIETGSVVFEDDPDFQFTSDWSLELTDDGWRIAEWIPSPNNQTVLCTVTSR
jgi:hypothetical protein